MKKNKMMRLASKLLVAVLLTTCVISSTFAKYVTTDDGSDTARVAKFGVVAYVTGTLFGQDYLAAGEEETSNKISAASGSCTVVAQSVEEGERDNIVAPGSESDEGLTLGLTGTPEVSTQVTVTVDTKESATYSNIYLKNASYGVMVVATGVTEDNFVGYYTKTEGNEIDGDTYTEVASSDSYNSKTTYYELIDTVDSSEATASTDERRFGDGYYYPLIWTITATNEAIESGSGNTLKEIDTFIKYAIGTKEYDPNTNLADSDKGFGSVNISWAWDFESKDKTMADLINGLDTILGDLMAYDANNKDCCYQVVVKVNEEWTGLDLSTSNGVTYAIGENNNKYACLTAGYNVKLTVEQVD